jgi:hypothetical protein
MIPPKILSMLHELDNFTIPNSWSIDSLRYCAIDVESLELHIRQIAFTDMWKLWCDVENRSLAISSNPAEEVEWRPLPIIESSNPAS